MDHHSMGEDRRVTGLSFGKSEVLLRIYDKALELSECADAEKAASLLNVNNWKPSPTPDWPRTQ